MSGSPPTGARRTRPASASDIAPRDALGRGRPGPSRPNLSIRSLLRAGLAIAIVVVTVFPAWWVLRAAIGDALVRHDPEAALAARPNDATALIGSAERDLSATPPRIGAASGRLRAALLGAPENARIYADLGLVAMLEGDGPLADRLFAIALGKSRRRIAPDLWAFDRSVRAGDFAAACGALDIILRTQPSSVLAIMAARVADLAAVPGAQAPLTRLLAADPPWRAGLLQVMTASPATADAVEPILDRLSGAKHPATEAEVAGVLMATIARGDYRRALATWRRLSPSGHAPEPGFLNDGRFRNDSGATPFAWTPAFDAGGAVILGGLADGTGLRVVLTDRSPGVPLLSQLLVAPPGDYVLAGNARSPGQARDRDVGLTWLLVCAATRQVLAETAAIDGGDRWRPFAVSFAVPGRGCEGQWLELHRRGTLTGLSGGASVWFDDLSVVPRPEPAR